MEHASIFSLFQVKKFSLLAFIRDPIIKSVEGLRKIVMYNFTLLGIIDLV